MSYLHDGQEVRRLSVQYRTAKNCALLTLSVGPALMKKISGHDLGNAVSYNLPEEVQDVLGPVSAANM